MASNEDGEEPFFLDVTCCGRCADGSGTRVSKMPEWKTIEEEDDEEEINFGSLSMCADRPRRPSVESWSSLGRLRPQDLDFSELTRENAGLRINNVDRRGINFEQLKKILIYVKKRCDSEEAVRGWYDHRTGEQLYYRKMTLAQLHYWLIHPVSLRHQCSYVEAIAKKEYAQLPAWFVGHSWNEPMVDFVRRVMKNGTLGAGDAFWCAAFSSRPRPGSTWQCEMTTLSDDFSVQPFRELAYLKANLKNCRSNSIEEWLSSAVPAVAELKSLDLSVSDSAKLLHAGSFVKGATSLVSLQTLHLDFRCPLQTADSLCRSLQNLNVLQVLDLDFSGCELKHLGGSCMTSPSSPSSPSSGSCLPNMTSLHTLKLDVTGCQHLSDIQVLSDDMQSLRILHLRLSQTALTSLENLVKPLEQITISDFELNVAYCSSLTNLGSLSSELRSGALERVRLNFCGCALPEVVQVDLQRSLAEISPGRDVLTLPHMGELGETQLSL